MGQAQHEIEQSELIDSPILQEDIFLKSDVPGSRRMSLIDKTRKITE